MKAVGRDPSNVNGRTETGGSAEPTTPVEHLVATVSRWPGVGLGPHDYDGVEFLLGDYEVGHAHHGWESVHVNYPRRMRDALIEAGRTEEHPYFRETGWTSRSVTDHGGVDDGLWLLRLSYLYRSLTRRNSPAARTALAELDVEAELDALKPSEEVRTIVEDVADRAVAGGSDG